MLQTKEDYTLMFPCGMCGEKTINVHTNPLSVKDVAAQVMKSQSLVFGDLCIIKDRWDNVLGIAYQGDRDGNGPRFYTEDDDVKQIKMTEDE